MVMVNANTEHYCDLFIFLHTSSLQTHTHTHTDTHTHTALTWQCSFRLNQCHACHISCQRSSLSPDPSPSLFGSSLHPLSMASLSFSACFSLLITPFRVLYPCFPSLSPCIPVSTLLREASASVPPIWFQTIQCGLTLNQTHRCWKQPGVKEITFRAFLPWLSAPSRGYAAVSALGCWLSPDVMDCPPRSPRQEKETHGKLQRKLMFFTELITEQSINQSVISSESI